MTFDFRIQIVHIRPPECNLHVKWGQFAINILNKSCFNGGLSKNHHFLCDFRTFRLGQPNILLWSTV